MPQSIGLERSTMKNKALLFSAAIAATVAVLLGQERYDPNAPPPRITIAEFCAGFLTDEIVQRHNALHAEWLRISRDPGNVDVRDLLWDEIVRKEQSWQRLDCKAILYPNGVQSQ